MSASSRELADSRLPTARRAAAIGCTTIRFILTVPTGEASSTARLVHLTGADAPPLCPPAVAPAMGSWHRFACKACLRHYISDDGSAVRSGGSPQRVCVDGAWRLNLGTSGSSPSLPKAEMGKRFVPLEQHNGRRLQLDNRT